MNVLWLTFIPSPYRLEFFSELGKQCNLTVLFERETSSYRKNTWNNYSFNGFEGKILKGITIGGHDRLCLSVIDYLKRDKYDIVVISNPTSPTGMLAAKWLQIKKIKYIVETDGAFPGKVAGFKRKLKQMVMCNAKLCLSTCDMNDEYFRELGIADDKIRRYPFTSLSNIDLINATELLKTPKSDYRKQLNIKESKIVLTVGRFQDNGAVKGFDILIEAVRRASKDIGFYFVGDDVPQEYLDIKEINHLDNVHFIGFQKKEELSKYYLASDMFILLTRGDVWGLVINEAMAYGLPIVTTKKCNAGLEMLKNGAGKIIDVGSVEQTLDSINEILNNDDVRYEMSKKSLETIPNYTFESMVDTHIKIFNEYRRV